MSAVKLNPAGDKAVLSLDTAPLLIVLINTVDGTLINSFKDNSLTFKEIVNGGLLFSSTGFIYMAIQDTSLRMNTVKIQAKATGPVTSSFFRQRDDTDSKIYNIIFGRSENEIFEAGYHKY